MDKEKSIKWMNALNNASLLVSWNLKVEQITESELKARVEDLANWFFTLNPKEYQDAEAELNAIFPYQELERKIQEANTKEELLALLAEVNNVAKDAQARVFWIFNDKKIKLK